MQILGEIPLKDSDFQSVSQAPSTFDVRYVRNFNEFHTCLIGLIIHMPCWCHVRSCPEGAEGQNW